MYLTIIISMIALALILSKSRQPRKAVIPVRTDQNISRRKSRQG